MAGIFSKSSRPKRPGAFFNFVAAEQQPILENTSGVVAIPFVHDWGPSNQVVDCNSFPDFLAKFGGASVFGAPYSRGYKAVRQAFQGEGLPGRGGAVKVLAIRMAGTDEAKATRALSNGAATAITIEARYSGSFGNRLRLTVQANAKNPGTHSDLVILDGTTELERFTYATADINALGAAVRESSEWADYTGVITSGTALTTVSSVALTGGDDGDTVVAGDWTDALTAFEPFRFSLFAPDNLTDSGVLASLRAWVITQNQLGKRFMAVVGGLAGETASTAITRSASLDDPNIVNVGIGTYEDASLGALSTAELAPRIAGILARRGEQESLTFARLAGLSITSGASVQNIIDAIDGGVITFARDSHPQAPVRIEKGVTSFVNEADAERPRNIYSVPKFIRTIHGLETEITEWAEINVIGRLPVNEQTRTYLRAQMEARLSAREEAGILQPGWSVSIDPTPAPTDTDDFVALLYQIKFGRSLEQILNTVVVG